MMQFGPSPVIGADILDIGTRKAEQQQQHRGVGSGAMRPPSLVLGEPGHFEIPNVADVSALPCSFYLGYRKPFKSSSFA
jgi:hypothetical protein